MRNLHTFIKEEFGEEGVLRLQLWKKIEKKMANNRNHRRFSIKCLKKEVIPVSINLKTNIILLKYQKLLGGQKKVTK